MASVDNIILATFVVYMVAVLSISFIAWRRNRNLKDYILAGRGLGSFVTALSAQASDMSGWLLLALPGAAYAFGLGYLWMVIGLATGTYLNWLIVARRLREQTQYHGDALTLPDYFSNRFGDRTHLLRGISALMILIFFAIYVASSFVAGAKLFGSLFDVSYTWALVLGALTVVSYTFIGGFLAVAWNDVLQGALMFIALVVISVIGLVLLGGFGGLAHAVSQAGHGLLNPFFNAEKNQTYTWIGILSLLAWGLGYFGQPHILARFMAIKNPDGIPVSRRIAMFWVIVALIAATLVGLGGMVLLNQPLAGAERERVFIYMALDLLPPVIAGICLSGILAAVMSTASAQLLVAASAFAEDIYRGFFRRHAGGRELLWIGRFTLLAVAGIAFWIGINPDSLVLGLVAYAWAGFGAAFGPCIILALYWRRMTWLGALAGIIVGGVTVLVWHVWLTPLGGFFALYEIVPGFILSMLAIVGASLATAQSAPRMPAGTPETQAE